MLDVIYIPEDMAYKEKPMILPSCDHGVPPDVSRPNSLHHRRLLAELTGWMWEAEQDHYKQDEGLAMPYPDESLLQDPMQYQPWLYQKATPKQKASQQTWQESLRTSAGAQFGQDCFVSPLAQVFTRRLKMGNRSWIAAHANIVGDVEFGADCSVNFYVVIEGKVTIGSGVRIAPHCVIMAANHGHADINTPVFQQPSTSVGIMIGDDVWLGAGVKVLDGVTVGSHCILAAGAVVTRDVPDYSIVAGVPARVIKDRRTGQKPATRSDLTSQVESFGRKVKDQWRDVLARDLVNGEYIDRRMGRAELTSLCCAVEMAALFDEVPAPHQKQELIEKLRSYQDPDGGLFPDPLADPTTNHRWPRAKTGREALYGVLAVGYALECLGGAPARPVACFDEMNATDLYQALKDLPWGKGAWGAGSWVDACGTAMYLNKKHFHSTTPLEPLFGWLNLHQDPYSGVWGRPRPSDGWKQPVNGFYRLTRGTYAQFGVPLPYPERTIDTVLAHLGNRDLFGEDRGNACDVLDVAHPLWLCSRQTDHRRDEIRRHAEVLLHRAVGGWIDGQGMSFTLQNTGRADGIPCLHTTEQWVATVYILAEILDLSSVLGYRPRGIHRTEPAWRIEPRTATAIE